MGVGAGVVPDWTVLVGTGFLGTVLLLALVERLRRTFATREEVKELSGKVSALEERWERRAAREAMLAEVERWVGRGRVG